MRLKDITGQRFGRLVAIRPISTGRNVDWVCQCDCGNETRVSGSNLHGNTKSCGCLRREIGKTKNAVHSMTKSREWNSWRAMRERCSMPSHNSYKYYGAKGVRVADEFMDFSRFFAYMGKCPDGYSLDRINASGNYEPGNVRWASSHEQRINRRQA